MVYLSFRGAPAYRGFVVDIAAVRIVVNKVWSYVAAASM
jgi:hypothetical protein